MKRSLNEIEHTCRKAVRGCGLPWGIADETGRAVRWLHLFQLDGVSSLASLLEEYDHHQPLDYAPQSLDGVWQGPNSLLSPVMTGPSLCDYIELMPEQGITTRRIACPILLAGFLGQSALKPEQSVTLSWLTVSLSFYCDRLMISGNKDDLYTDRVNSLTCTRTPFSCDGDDDGDALSPKIGDAQVNTGAWERLEQYAWLTYVKATEASRLSGAGAGLNDND